MYLLVKRQVTSSVTCCRPTTMREREAGSSAKSRLVVSCLRWSLLNDVDNSGSHGSSSLVSGQHWYQRALCQLPAAHQWLITSYQLLDLTWLGYTAGDAADQRGQSRQWCQMHWPLLIWSESYQHACIQYIRISTTCSHRIAALIANSRPKCLTYRGLDMLTNDL